MRAKAPTLLVAALIVAAALVLHELRYLVGYGEQAGAAVAEQGHGYLANAGTAALLLLALGAGQLLLGLRRALRSATSSPSAPFGVLWLASASALLGVHVGQELLEGVFSSGHADGVAAVVANGGWSALPLALLLGAGVALVLRGAAAAEAYAARRAARAPARRPRLAATPLRPAAPILPVLSVLARKLAGRAPPAALGSQSI